MFFCRGRKLFKQPAKPAGKYLITVVVSLLDRRCGFETVDYFYLKRRHVRSLAFSPDIKRRPSTRNVEASSLPVSLYFSGIRQGSIISPQFC